MTRLCHTVVWSTDLIAVGLAARVVASTDPAGLPLPLDERLPPLSLLCLMVGEARARRTSAEETHWGVTSVRTARGGRVRMRGIVARGDGRDHRHRCHLAQGGRLPVESGATLRYRRRSTKDTTRRHGDRSNAVSPFLLLRHPPVARSPHPRLVPRARGHRLRRRSTTGVPFPTTTIGRAERRRHLPLPRHVGRCEWLRAAAPSATPAEIKWCLRWTV
mmetsp:Transcript_31363/g.56167  ORF Transcript_31363/g.56167 Transcript_31363/m.56167 type:complete len:218 (-) Transcript_31363:840-1493(-)